MLDQFNGLALKLIESMNECDRLRTTRDELAAEVLRMRNATEPMPSRADVRDMLVCMCNGRRIEAIAKYRKIFNTGLDEAKNVIDTIMGVSPSPILPQHPDV
jgi:ribosomal protein L7/L12